MCLNAFEFERDLTLRKIYQVTEFHHIYKYDIATLLLSTNGALK